MTNKVQIQDLLDRAEADPALLAELVSDPLGTARAAGLQFSGETLKSLLGVSGATDQELLEVLRQRVIISGRMLGCGSDCRAP